MALVAGCGSPEYTYVTNSTDCTYLKVPTTWRQIDGKAMDDAIAALRAAGASIVGTCSNVSCTGVTNVAGEFGYEVTSFPGGFHAIATAYGDYTKKSFEDTRSFVEKLSGVKSFDKAIEIQTEFAKSAFETFMAESQKIGALYRDLATQSYKPFGGLLAKMTPTNR